MILVKATKLIQIKFTGIGKKKQQIQQNYMRQ